MNMILKYLVAAAVSASGLCATAGAVDKILFIRGGVGTVGFFEGGSDEHGADIANYATNGGNHGWGELSAALVAEGFELEQLAEDPVIGGVPTPVPLDALDLSQYAVIVFGSNNAEYTEAQVDTFVFYIAGGGSGLFVSDANFGQDWGDAPSSDQLFLSRFGLTMNQDRGTYLVERTDEFLVPDHPIFNGVDTFDGEGVSPITVSFPVTNVTSTVLAAVPDGQQVRRNTSSGQGTSSVETAADGTLVIATLGNGRIAGHFDRNTFFNLDGAGTNLNRFDNESYARNLFNWLADKPDFDPATDNYAPRLHVPTDPPAAAAEGQSLTLGVVAKDPDGSVARVEISVDGGLVGTDTTAPYSLNTSALVAGMRTIGLTAIDNDGGSTTISFEVDVQDSADISLPLVRDGWTLDSNRSTGELGNATDGNLGTRWPTRQFQQAGQLFGIDLGARQLFERIVLETPSNPNDYPRGYIVRGSDDGSNFTVLATGAGDGATTEITFPAPVTYRHIQIEQTGSSGVNWWSIDEVNVYAPAVNAVLPLGSWLQFHFADNPAALGADSDGDGLTTLEEFAANTDPNQSGVSPLALKGAIDAETVDLSFRRWRSDVENGVSYEVEFSTDLSGWAAIATELVGEAMSNRDGTETVTLRVTPPESGLRGFLRLRYTLSP